VDWMKFKRKTFVLGAENQQRKDSGSLVEQQNYPNEKTSLTF
jgi:hypothetical protein